MNFKNLILILMLFGSIFAKAQNNKNTLFTIENEAFSSEEFLRVFNKNRDIVTDENKKTIPEYLELYINYKLKLKQAYDLKYDTISAYKKEFEKYRAQLIAPYLKDSKVTESLVKEAYDRMKVEANASHILVRVSPKASPTDTLIAYNKCIEARNKILSGEAFETVAKQYSDDPSAQKNGGNLGYFSAFSMVYSFENVVYTTKKNEISMPFKTQFGYHILKVNDFRAAKGEVEVAHIMIKENETDSLYAKTKIAEIYAKLHQNENFELLAKLHSDDKKSSINGGVLPKFNASRMIEPFASIAFSLESKNALSAPFKTQFGWHVVKLIQKHPVKEFSEMKAELTERIEKSDRAKAAGKSVVNRLKNEYKIIEDSALRQAFLKKDSLAISSDLQSTIFSINGIATTLKELVSFEDAQNNNSSRTRYDNFLASKIIEYYKANLEKTEPDFAFTLNEYKDGLLLFDVLQDKVWRRSDTDSVGLANFYELHKNKYMWPKRGDVLLATCKKKEKALLVKKHLEAGKSNDEIKELVNDGAIIHVIFTKGILEEGHKRFPKNFSLDKTGVSKVYNEENSNFVIVDVKSILEPELKKLNEAKGTVINDFQEYLEKNWIADLRQQYKISINNKVLKRLVKQNSN